MSIYSINGIEFSRYNGLNLHILDTDSTMICKIRNYRDSEIVSGIDIANSFTVTNLRRNYHFYDICWVASLIHNQYEKGDKPVVITNENLLLYLIDRMIRRGSIRYGEVYIYNGLFQAHPTSTKIFELNIERYTYGIFNNEDLKAFEDLL